MMFDTDVLVWIQRGNRRAARAFERERDRRVSVFTYMELLQCARDRAQRDASIDFLRELGVSVLPLTENIGHRAAIYIEQMALSHGLRAGDALIAATAVENGQVLCTADTRHMKSIPDLRLKVIRP